MSRAKKYAFYWQENDDNTREIDIPASDKSTDEIQTKFNVLILFIGIAIIFDVGCWILT